MPKSSSSAPRCSARAQSEGNSGGSGTFKFTEQCSADQKPFDLKAGNKHTLKSVLVDTKCLVEEVNDGSDDRDARISITQQGDRLADVEASNTETTVDPNAAHPVDGGVDGAAANSDEETEEHAGKPEDSSEALHRDISFTVLPVAQASDLSNSGPAWSLTALNSFANMNVTKTIDGAPISEAVDGVTNTAVLPDDAQSMRVHYKVANDGAGALSNFAIKDPSLAGRTVSRVGSGDTTTDDSFTVGEEGVIPAGFCGLGDGAEIASGAENECVFDVDISNEPMDKMFRYSGEVTVTADTQNLGKVTGKDSYGAIRLPQSVAWMLPDTGRQTLVWVLVLGLIALAIGLLRYLRKDDEEEADAALEHSRE